MQKPPTKKIKTEQTSRGLFGGLSLLFCAGPKAPKKSVNMENATLNKKLKKKPMVSLKSYDSDGEVDEESDNSVDQPPLLKKYDSDCVVDSDDMAGDLYASDNGNDGVQNRAEFKQMRTKKRKSGVMKKSNKRVIEFDTNVFQVNLDCLVNEGEVATGDAVLCQECSAVFSKFSSVTLEGEEDLFPTIWTCEFCNSKNKVMIDDEEVPKQNEMTYLIEAAPQVAVGQDTSIVFCVDISESMSLYENRMSRFQWVSFAIYDQIEKMSKVAEAKKVGIVTFENNVNVIGDGTQEPQLIGSDQLKKFEFLKKAGSAFGNSHLQKPVKTTWKLLLGKLAKLHPSGWTALGPAVLTSVCMAAEGKSGSKVVICTDGLANIGLGAFNSGYYQEFEGDEEEGSADKFYESVAKIAQEAGVTVDIFTIKGDECNIDSLSKLAEMTGGFVERINPASLTRNFAGVLSIPIIATKVEAKVKIHKGLQFRNELSKDVTCKRTILTKQFGNVTAGTVFTFEYGLKPISELVEMQDLDMSKITHFPFQTQIEYTALDGSKCLRVITKQ